MQIQTPAGEMDRAQMAYFIRQTDWQNLERLLTTRTGESWGPHHGGGNIWKKAIWIHTQVQTTDTHHNSKSRTECGQLCRRVIATVFNVKWKQNNLNIHEQGVEQCMVCLHYYLLLRKTWETDVFTHSRVHTWIVRAEAVWYNTRKTGRNFSTLLFWVCVSQYVHGENITNLG